MNTLNTWAFSKMVAIIAIVSAVINELLALVGRAVSAPPETFGPYMASSVVGLTLVGVVGAGIVYWGMRRWCAKDVAQINRRFIILSVVLLVLSFYPDVALPWSTDPDQVGWTYGIMANLMLMHVVAAGLVMYYFTKKTA